MATKFISDKTTYLYEGPTGRQRSMILIFGDEVETNGASQNNRTPVTFRGRHGFVADHELGDEPALELYFIDVGQGDSTFIVTPQRKTILIDGGVNRRALGFLAWKYRLDNPGNEVDIDLLVMSHADDDHLAGLIPIIQHPRIHVRQIVHSGIATFRPGTLDTTLGDTVEVDEDVFVTTRDTALAQFTSQELTERYFDWKEAIRAEPHAPTYSAVAAGTDLTVNDDSVTLEVLAPITEQVGGVPAYRWFDDKSHTINGHSVVLKLTHNDVSVILPGDINIEGAEHLLADAGITARLDAHVFKAPHHGSHEYHPPFLAAIRPQISVISSGDEPDHGHPRAAFIGGVGNASRSSNPLVFSTEIAATFVEARDIEVRPGTSGNDAEERRLFKRRLHGMINVRTNGTELFAARRVVAGYWWEAYGPVAPAP